MSLKAEDVFRAVIAIFLCSGKAILNVCHLILASFSWPGVDFRKLSIFVALFLADIHSL